MRGAAFSKMGKEKLYVAPVNSGNAYGGNTFGMRNVGRPGVRDCNRVVTRVYLGTLGIYNPSGDTSFAIQPPSGGAVENKGNFYFCPTNGAYMSYCSLLTMARLYTWYWINKVSFDFETLLSPGQQNAYRCVWGFVDDPLFMRTFVSGYNPAATNTKAIVLSLNPSKSQPLFVPKFTIGPPARFYKNKKFWLRGPDLEEIINVSTASSQSLDRQSYAFGMILMVDGPTPTSNLNVADVFMNIDIDLCDLTTAQTLDLENSTALSQKRTGDSAPSKFSAEQKFVPNQQEQLDALNARLKDLEVKGLKEESDLEIWEPTEVERKKEEVTQPGQKKSSSNKSTRSTSSVNKLKE